MRDGDTTELEAAIVRDELASLKAERTELREALHRLVKMYVANAGFDGHEFISCITPSHSSDMTEAERAEDATWRAWDKARAVLAKGKS